MNLDIVNEKIEVRGQIVPREKLDASTVKEMFRLFSRYFDAHDHAVFESDLAAKDSVILMWSGNKLVGFSTVRIDRLSVAGKQIAVFVSGDTIIDRVYWASGVLERCWLLLALETKQKLNCPLYWLLICSGYRTYRYLPTFFREFWPRYNHSTPTDIQELLDRIATHEYGERYQGGIVKLEGGYLREGVSPVDERHLSNPDVAFFVQANPGHAHGDELACLTLIDQTNLTQAGQRVFRQVMR